MNRYMDTTGQRFYRMASTKTLDANRTDTEKLDFATWHTRLRGHNDGGASSETGQVIRRLRSADVSAAISEKETC